MTTEVPSSVVPPAAPEMPSFDDATTTTTEAVAATTTTTTEAVAAATTATTTTGVPETQIEKLLYWRDLKISGIVFGSGTLLFILTGILKYSFLAITSYCLLLLMIGCFLYINGSKLLVGYIGEERIPKPTFGIEPFSEEAVHAKVDPAVEVLNDGIAKAHELLLCKDNMATLKAIGVVFGVYIVGRIFPDLVLCYLIFLALFTLPKIYEQNKEQIDATVEQTRARVMEESEKALKIANERSAEFRASASKKIIESATPLMDKYDVKNKLAGYGVNIPGMTTTTATATTTTPAPTETAPATTQ